MNNQTHITQKELNQVIEILKRADSIWINVDCLRFPIRKIIGRSKGDIKFLSLKQELERMKVIDGYADGFWSLAETPGFLYITGLRLEKEWFERNCIVGRIEGDSNQIAMF